MKTFVPADDAALLTGLVAEAKAASFKLAQHMLGELAPETVELVARLQLQGWRLGLECSIDKDCEPLICLTAISPSGERRALADVAQGAPAGAH
jgi:hypothetical protein